MRLSHAWTILLAIRTWFVLTKVNFKICWTGFDLKTSDILLVLDKLLGAWGIVVHIPTNVCDSGIKSWSGRPLPGAETQCWLALASVAEVYTYCWHQSALGQFCDIWCRWKEYAISFIVDRTGLLVYSTLREISANCVYWFRSESVFGFYKYLASIALCPNEWNMCITFHVTFMCFLGWYPFKNS